MMLDKTFNWKIWEKNLVKRTSAEKTKVTIVLFCFKLNSISKLFAQIGLKKKVSKYEWSIWFKTYFFDIANMKWGTYKIFFEMSLNSSHVIISGGSRIFHGAPTIIFLNTTWNWKLLERERGANPGAPHGIRYWWHQ